MAKNKRIGKIKYTFDDILFKGNAHSGHNVYVSAHDKRSGRVMVNVISSIADASGTAKPNAVRQIKMGMLMPISSTRSSFQRFSGIKLDGLIYNNRQGRNLEYTDLSTSKIQSSLDRRLVKKVQRFVFANSAQPIISRKNRERARFK